MAALPPHLERGIARAVTGVNRAHLQQAVERLQATYFREQPTKKVIVADHLLALAYLGYRLPATYAAARHVLAQLPASLAPSTMTDLGGGSGAAAWAALDLFGTSLTATVVDQSLPSLRVGESVQEGSGHEVTWLQRSVDDALGATDLLMLGYLIGELSPFATTALLMRARNVATTIAVLEPGTPTGFRRILDVRQGMLDAGWHLVAPCPHAGTCPWSDDGRDWCHASTRVQRPPIQQQLKGGKLSHEDEKVAYVVATREPIETPMSRVLRHPRKPKGMVEFPVCHEDGTVHDVTVTKRRDSEAYRLARNVGWGDAWDPEQMN